MPWSEKGRDIRARSELDAMLRDLREDMRDIESGGISGFPYPPDDPPADDPPWA